MRLGELIKALEAADHSMVVPVGFCGPHSYRGDYSELAFEPCGETSVREMLGLAQGALGKTFEGYKGGDFVMGQHTPCWLAYYGESDGEAIGQMLLYYMISSPVRLKENYFLLNEVDV